MTESKRKLIVAVDCVFSFLRTKNLLGRSDGNLGKFSPNFFLSVLFLFLIKEPCFVTQLLIMWADDLQLPGEFHFEPSHGSDPAVSQTIINGEYDFFLLQCLCKSIKKKLYSCGSNPSVSVEFDGHFSGPIPHECSWLSN